VARIPAVKAELKLSVAIDKFNAALIKHISVVQTDVSKAVVGVAHKLEAMAKRRCPVDTGRLRASIHTVTYGQASDLSRAPRNATQAVVGTNVDYALYIEAGHSSQAPAGFMRISVEELRGELLAGVKSELQRHKRLGSA